MACLNKIVRYWHIAIKYMQSKKSINILKYDFSLMLHANHMDVYCSICSISLSIVINKIGMLETLAQINIMYCNGAERLI